MESPQSEFVVPSLNSFHRRVKGTVLHTPRNIRSIFVDKGEASPSPSSARALKMRSRGATTTPKTSPSPSTMPESTRKVSKPAFSTPIRVATAKSPSVIRPSAASVLPKSRQPQTPIAGTSGGKAAAPASQTRRALPALTRPKTPRQLPTPPPTPPPEKQVRVRQAAQMGPSRTIPDRTIAAKQAIKAYPRTLAPAKTTTPRAKPTARPSICSPLASEKKRVPLAPKFQPNQTNVRINNKSKDVVMKVPEMKTSVRRPVEPSARRVGSIKVNKVVPVPARKVVKPKASEAPSVQVPAPIHVSVPAPTPVVESDYNATIVPADAIIRLVSETACVQATPSIHSISCDDPLIPSIALSDDPVESITVAPTKTSDVESSLVEVKKAVMEQLQGALKVTGAIPPRRDVNSARIGGSRPTDTSDAKSNEAAVSKTDDTRRVSRQQCVASGSSIQARIASMFSSAGVKPSTLARDGARVCRLRTPELLETDKASKDARIQREIEALRGLQRVGCGSKIIAKTRAFGGDGPANAPLSGGVALSLQAIEILERVKKEQARS